MAQWELRQARQAATAKFSRAAQMLFTRVGYEQSSSETITSYRTGCLRHAHRYLNIQRLNYLSTIRHSSARIAGNMIT